MAASTWSRKLDYVYVTLLAIYLLIMLFFDLTQFYPTWLRPAFTVAIEEKYIEDYRDRFFIDPPLWFRGFSVLEGLYQLPLCLWAIPAILRNDPLVPLQLLVFAVHGTVSTLTCVLEIVSWQGYSWEEQSQLLWMYVPFLVVVGFMGIDMFMRLRTTLLSKSKMQ